eukprot:gnl/TRDRNA2_/TRDRNA2_127678_c0_seq1.p1 gnl/TRDRNA2_/TRDRNA2_127678_c0~~gnl/TRDRNA2_/TRDRNA2_127678_c0_seq1.p1  ORF type:complete len:1009 (-),score=186.90 gnl/TRDRNA2_/TRDRNA2_127678_c0_seq1:67-3093(-)
MALRDDEGKEAVVGISIGLWLEEADFIFSGGSTDGDGSHGSERTRIGAHGFPRDWPEVYSQSRALKSLIGKRGPCAAIRTAVMGVPEKHHRHLAEGLQMRRLHSFVNAEALRRSRGLAVVKGWAIYDLLRSDPGEAFVAERYWWNATADGEWVDFTPRPEAMEELLVAEALQATSKETHVLREEQLVLAARLWKRRFPTEAFPLRPNVAQKWRQRAEASAVSAAPRAFPTPTQPASSTLQSFSSWMKAILQEGMIRMPALRDAKDVFDKVPEIRMGPAPFSRRSFENAGRAFLETHEGMSRANILPTTVKSDPPVKMFAAAAGPARQQQTCASGKRPRARERSRSKPPKAAGCLTEQIRHLDLYALLGLKVEQDTLVTVEDIKNTYRKMVLKYHPDKQTSTARSSIDTLQASAAPKKAENPHFTKVQEAYEYLCDMDRLQRYDSTRPFDDSIPSEDEVKNCNFFDIFAPVFARNAKWSVQHPVPSLGDENTPVEIVQDFYRFWFDFDSWRDVSSAFQRSCGQTLHHIDHNIHRNERRVMQKENEELRKRWHKAEVRRLYTLVERAWWADKRLPRKQVATQSIDTGAPKPCRRHISAGERARLKAQRESEESTVTSAQQLPNAEEEKRLEHKRKEEERQALKNARQRVRGAVRFLHLPVCADQLQEHCLKLSHQELEMLTKELDGVVQDLKQGLASETDTKNTGMEILFRSMQSHGISPVQVTNSSKEVGDERAEKARTKRAPLPERKKQAAGESRQHQADAKDAFFVDKLDAGGEAPRKGCKHQKDEGETKETNELDISPSRPKRVGDEHMKELRHLQSQNSAAGSTQDEAFTEEKLTLLEEFFTAGGTAEAALELALKSVKGNSELSEDVKTATEQFALDPEIKIDAVCALLGESAASFFELGVRPVKSMPVLQGALRNRVKRVRLLLRGLCESSLLPSLAGDDPENEATKVTHALPQRTGVSSSQICTASEQVKGQQHQQKQQQVQRRVRSQADANTSKRMPARAG